MFWKMLHIPIHSDDVEVFSDILFDLGALSVSIEDADEGTPQEKPIFGEPGEPTQQLWDRSVIIALFNKEVDVDHLLTFAANQAGICKPIYQVSSVKDQDWVRLTQSQFSPIFISDRLWITPTWHACPDPTAISIQLDPGLAFGTGSHPTTRLCLQWLDTHLKQGNTVLDYGCGSGILCLAAAKLGASIVDGVDIDPQALIASRQNANQNGVSARFFLPTEVPNSQYDIVVANILSNPLKALVVLLVNKVVRGGHIVLSGVLVEQAEEMKAIYRPWITFTDQCLSDEGWVCLSGIRDQQV